MEKRQKCGNCMAKKSLLSSDAINNVRWMRRKERHQVLALAKRYKKNTPAKLLSSAVHGIFAYQIYVRNSLSLFSKRKNLHLDYLESFFNEIISHWGEGRGDKTTLKSFSVHLSRLFFSHRLCQHPFASLHMFAFVVKLHSLFYINIWWREKSKSSKQNPTTTNVSAPQQDD